MSNDRWLQKITWFILTIASVSYCSSRINSSVINNFQYPVVTNIMQVDEKESEFPAVTCCYFDTEAFSRETACTFDNMPCSNTSVFYKNSNCISFNFGINASGFPAETVRTKQPGIMNGLILLLRLIPSRSYINIYVHNRSLNTDNSKLIFVSTGMDLSLVVKRIYHKKLSKPFSNCKADYSFTLGAKEIINKTSFQYFQPECITLCSFQKRIEACQSLNEYLQIEQYYHTNQIYFFYAYHSLIDSITPYSNYIETDYSIVSVYYEDLSYTLMTQMPQISSDVYLERSVVFWDCFLALV